MSIISATMGMAEGDYGWTGSIELGPDSMADFSAMNEDDELVFNIADSPSALIIDELHVDRGGGIAPKMTVKTVSPTAWLAQGRALPISITYFDAMMARAICEDLAGQPIDWQIDDWLIPGGRVSVYQGYPMDVIKSIAQDAGGVVFTHLDGSLATRPKFPIAVPEWYNVTPDVVLTDIADILSYQTTHKRKWLVDRVVVRGWLPQLGQIATEIDAAGDGTNQGITTFMAGDTAGILVQGSANVTAINLAASAGTISPGPHRTRHLQEDLTFSGSNQADSVLKYIASSIEKFIWIGPGLGNITVQTDGKTVIADSSGLGVVRVWYYADFDSWLLKSPSGITGIYHDLPIMVQALGSAGDFWGDAEEICQRGEGLHPGTDVSSPVLSSQAVKQARGQQELDDGTDFQQVSMTVIHHPELLPGMLTEIHDELMGPVWRGKITSVEHLAQGPKITTNLEILKYVQTD